MQDTKQADPEWVAAMQELRRSSAARPHRNRKKYTRKRKHKAKEQD